MRVRLGDRKQVTELALYFRSRGFLVVERGAGKVDIHPLNHVSARSDAFLVSAILDEWRLTHPDVAVDELA